MSDQVDRLKTQLAEQEDITQVFEARYNEAHQLLVKAELMIVRLKRQLAGLGQVDTPA